MFQCAAINYSGSTRKDLIKPHEYLVCTVFVINNQKLEPGTPLMDKRDDLTLSVIH